MTNFIAGEHHNYHDLSRKEAKPFKILKHNFDLNIISNNNESLKFEMFNTPCEIHNAIRRLILNEVPSVAFDRVFIYNNTTCIEDSDLQLRIGLTPVDINPDILDHYEQPLPNTDDLSTFEHNACLLFEINVDYNKLETVNIERFERFTDQSAKKKYLESYKARRDKSVYSNDLKWCPLLGQEENFGPVNLIDDILLVRMMPGEELIVKALAVKGYGHDHAKFMPACVAHGRRALTLKILSPIEGKSALLLQKLFPKGVIKIVKHKAVVGNVDLIQRSNKNFYEYEDLKDKIELGFDESRYIWHIESVRPTNQSAKTILISAFHCMIEKCRFYQENLEKLLEATEASRDEHVDAKLFGKKISGKFCYIERDFRHKNFPFFRFHGESATLGVSLSFMLNYLYGERIACSYFDVEQGVELAINVVGNIDVTVESMLEEGIKKLLSYFKLMLKTFKEKMSNFYNNDIDMD